MMWRPFDTEKCKFVVILLQKGRLFGGVWHKYVVQSGPNLEVGRPKDHWTHAWLIHGMYTVICGQIPLSTEVFMF